jgi:hypothetical protein
MGGSSRIVGLAIKIRWPLFGLFDAFSDPAIFRAHPLFTVLDARDHLVWTVVLPILDRSDILLLRIDGCFIARQSQTLNSRVRPIDIDTQDAL